MEVFNKFYSSVSNTVSNTVSQLSSVLGNPITKEFEVGEHIGSAGPGLSWKVYKGIKKSTKQNVSVFVFDKNNLKYLKEEREAILEMLKRGVVQLTKIRHPRILTVQHPLEEGRDSLAFVTEPVFQSLANILGNYGNMPPQAEINAKPFNFHEIEIKYGLIQLMEGLQFLHSDMKMIHRNISPESIVLNVEGGWKLFGFDYCSLLNSENGAATTQPYVPKQRNILLQPLLDYAAPEWIIEANCVCASDIYSLGILIYTIHSQNKKPIKLFGTDVDSYKRFAADVKLGKYPNLNCIPNGIVDNVRLMLHFSPELRPNLYELPKIGYFDEFGVKALIYLESLYQFDNIQKSKFFKGLPQILDKFPKRVNVKQILPCLAREFVNAAMIPFVLPNVLLIVQNSATPDEYTTDIQRHLLPIMKIPNPIHILLIFMQNIELLIKLSSAEVIKTDLLGLVNRSLECELKEIQELGLAILPTMANHIDFSVLKSSLFPRIKKLCINTQSVSVKVNCLICLGKLLEIFDKWFVLDEVIPFLIQIPSRDPAVLMGVIGIFKLILTHKKLGMTKEVMANKVIPFLVPLSIENGLSVTQFNSIMMMVKEILSTIENEHRARLEQLNSVRDESKKLESSLATQLTSQFPEFTLSDFKSSCLNNQSKPNSTDIFKKEEFTSLSSSVSMPTFAPLTPSPQVLSTNNITEEKRNLPAIKPPPSSASMNFTLDKRTQQQQQPQQQTFSTNSSFFAQTTSPPTSLPSQMHQLPQQPHQQQHLPPQQPRNFPNQFPTKYPLPSNNNLNLLSPIGGSNNKPDATSNKQIQLSAQEINDFLSS